MQARVGIALRICLAFCLIGFVAMGQTQARAIPKTIDDLSSINQATSALQSNHSLADSLVAVILNEKNSYSESKRAYSLIFIAEWAFVNEQHKDYIKYVEELKSIEISATEQRLAFYKDYHQFRAKRLNNNLQVQDLTINSMLKHAKGNRSFYLLSEAYDEIACAYVSSNEKDSALLYSDLGIQYARRSGSKRRLFESFLSQASVYESIGKFELAVSKTLVAYQLAQGENNLLGIAKIGLKLGELQLSIRNIRQAKTYLNEAQSAARQLHSTTLLSRIYTTLGELYRLEDNTRKSLQYHNRAKHESESKPSTPILALISLHRGRLFIDLQEFERADLELKQALNLLEKVQVYDFSPQIYYTYASSLQQQGKISRALQLCQSGINHLQQNKMPFALPDLYLLESQLYDRLGLKGQALTSLQTYVNFREQTGSEKKTRDIAELSEQYLTEQRDRLISAQADSLARQQELNELNQTRLEIANLRNNLQAYLIVGFFLLLILAGIIGYSVYRRKIVEQKNRESEMAQTLLRSQMNPHFIFNAMSVIQSYIYENDVKNSTKFLVNFSRLMRLILENSPKEFISIELEIEILNKYLETQKLRFEERFSYTITCDHEVHTEKAMIPPMITQPFIENAIEHGQLHTVENGHIYVDFKKNKDSLEVTIMDNGVGRAEAEKNKKGKSHKSLATQITKDRIANLNTKYSTEGFLKLTDADEASKSGTKVLIALPYKTEDI